MILILIKYHLTILSLYNQIVLTSIRIVQNTLIKSYMTYSSNGMYKSLTLPRLINMIIFLNEKNDDL